MDWHVSRPLIGCPGIGAQSEQDESGKGSGQLLASRHAPCTWLPGVRAAGSQGQNGGDHDDGGVSMVKKDQVLASTVSPI